MSLSDKNAPEQLMKRELSVILTPGTLVDDDLLESSMATYLLSIMVSRFFLPLLSFTALLLRHYFLSHDLSTT